MIVEAQVTINGPKAATWAAMTNIENASQIITGIEKIEVVRKPANRLVGLGKVICTNFANPDSMT